MDSGRQIPPPPLRQKKKKKKTNWKIETIIYILYPNIRFAFCTLIYMFFFL